MLSEGTSILVRHARTELELLEEEEEVIEYYVETVLSFVELRGDQYSFFHGDFKTLLDLFLSTCDYSSTEVVQTISDLLHLKPLSPLTDNPDEWLHHKDVVHDKGLGVWQNRRDPSAFSGDEGRTYSLLSEGHLTEFRTPLHTSQQIKKD